MIYLDHAAATPVCKQALVAMLPYFSDEFFNPSSPYLPAVHLRRNYEYAKNQIAHSISAKGNDIVITAGATESINLAFTAIKNLAASEEVQKNILVFEIEHQSVLAVAEVYAEEYGLELRKVRTDRTGMVDLNDFRRKLDENTVFVTVSLANNELGTIQPLAEISEIIEKEQIKRLERAEDADSRGSILPIMLHSDASQALNLIDISTSRLGVDLLTINSAKVGGPKGIGALFVAHGVKLSPIVYGGGQESGLRSGTENVAGVIGFAAAATEAKEHLSGNRKKYEKLTQIMRKELEKAPVQPLFLGNKKHQLSNFLPVSFPGLDAERLIYLLEDKGVLVSTGAACAANKGKKSHVLTAIGLSEAEVAGSLRISLGVLNNEENVKKAGELIVQAVSEEYERLEND